MTRLIARQHLLPSLSWLLQRVATSGRYSAIDLVGKDYSTLAPAIRIPSVISLRATVSACFQKVGEEELILLDEGGDLHRNLPMSLAERTAAIEQTTAGMQATWKCPTVLVCRSAAKLVFESQIIARGILRKLDSLSLLDGRGVGVIGLGSVGVEIARSLLARGGAVFATDPYACADDLAHIRVDIDQLLHSVDLLLGCTGLDVLDRHDLASVTGRKIFVSCSSSDIEFRSVLAKLPAIERFGHVQGWVGGLHCTVLNGGFPINFDRIREWELPEEILLTRMLILEGLEQALPLIGSKARGVMLSPASQMRIIGEWLEQLPDRTSIRLPRGLTEEYLRSHSEGEDQGGS